MIEAKRFATLCFVSKGTLIRLKPPPVGDRQRRVDTDLGGEHCLLGRVDASSAQLGNDDPGPHRLERAWRLPIQRRADLER